MTFYDFLIRHFKKNVKSHVFLNLKKRKIRILEHCRAVKCSGDARIFFNHDSFMYEVSFEYPLSEPQNKRSGVSEHFGYTQ